MLLDSVLRLRGEHIRNGLCLFCASSVHIISNFFGWWLFDYVIFYGLRFFRQLFLLFAVHLASLSMFRFLASVFQTMNTSMAAGTFSILLVLSFGGFVIMHRKETLLFLQFDFKINNWKINSSCVLFAASMPVWLKWAFWVSPITYGEIGLSVNEFLAPRWQKVSFLWETFRFL